jgi:cell wall-associated NlpC family hydrolase
MFIKPSELQPGDVLLYHGNSFISRLIRLFDGTEYSHASIWVGDHVVEAIGQGVVGRSLAVSTADVKYTDVYRYRNKDSGLNPGDEAVPAPRQARVGAGGAV